MVIVDEEKEKFAKAKKLFDEMKGALDLPALEARRKELEENQNEEGFWNDVRRAQTVNRELARIEGKIEDFAKLKKRAEDAEALISLVEEDGDEETKAELSAELDKLIEDLEELRLQTLLTGKYDANDAIVTLHAGAGGTEAQDWVSMLYRMYTRYAERNGYKVTVLDSLPGDEAGIKSVTFSVEGENAYGYLEHVHRYAVFFEFRSPLFEDVLRRLCYGSYEILSVVVLFYEFHADEFRALGKHSGFELLVERVVIPLRVIRLAHQIGIAHSRDDFSDHRLYLFVDVEFVEDDSSLFVYDLSLLVEDVVVTQNVLSYREVSVLDLRLRVFDLLGYEF